MSESFVSNFKEVQRNLESFTFRLGIFPENEQRKEVIYNKKIRVRNVGYRNKKSRKISKVKNSDILRKEYQMGRNWLLDAVDKEKNPDAIVILKLLNNFIRVEKQDFDFWVRNRQRCNGMVAIFRRSVDRDLYNIHNTEATIELKGFDAYLRNTRQLQNSVTCKLLYGDKKISEAKNANSNP